MVLTSKVLVIDLNLKGPDLGLDLKSPGFDLGLSILGWATLRCMIHELPIGLNGVLISRGTISHGDTRYIDRV